MKVVDNMAIPWLIELRAPHLMRPLRVFVKDRVVVGRVIPGRIHRPDVDLGASDEPDHPVAGEHFSLTVEEDALVVTDLNSASGTFLNGEPLTPYVGQKIAHGDVLRLGKLRLEIAIMLSPASTGGMHYQPGLNLYDQTQPGEGQWVMIVEDDPEIARVLSQLVEEAGYATRVVHDGVNAIRAFSQKQPNAIILDLDLPDMNGLELCRYVRRDVLHNTVPILAINSQAQPTEAANAMQAGANVVMDEPLNAGDLRDIVVGLVNQHENKGDAIRTRRIPHVSAFEVFPPSTSHRGAVIYVSGYDNDPILVNGQDAVSFGRQPGTGSLGSKTHIDLTRYDAANCGVSRVHLFLHCQNGQYYVEDVGSRNGTFVNGVEIRPYEYAPVQNGDEIRLGLLRMHVYFYEDRGATE